jgi:hypothetical protein
MVTMVENKKTIRMKVDLSDYRGLLKALSVMDKESQAGLKDDVAIN